MGCDIEIIIGNLNNDEHNINFIKLLNEYISDNMGGGTPVAGKQAKKIINDICNFPTSLIFFAKHKEIFVGMSVCFLGYSTFKAKKLINIHDIIISKEFRNKGIGKILLNKIFEKGKELDCCKITLEVRIDNENAKHLYKSLGFEDTDPQMLFWSKLL